jgi:hypothetical protein
VKPDAKGTLHNSMNWAWRILEYIPRRSKWKQWPGRRSFLGFYLPRAEPRPIPEGTLIHRSVIERREAIPGYRPENLPLKPNVEP